VREIVIDASVAAKWYLPAEEGEKQALAILDEYVMGKLSIIAPSLLYYEVANALLVASRRERISEETYRQAVGSLFELALTIQPLEQYWELALKMAVDYQRSIYDAAYLALAASRNVKLVTGDRRLFNAAGAHLPWIVWIEETISKICRAAFFPLQWGVRHG
jgi:predicted nucleic acid-binding protein